MLWFVIFLPYMSDTSIALCHCFPHAVELILHHCAFIPQKTLVSVNKEPSQSDCCFTSIMPSKSQTSNAHLYKDVVKLHTLSKKTLTSKVGKGKAKGWLLFLFVLHDECCCFSLRVCFHVRLCETSRPCNPKASMPSRARERRIEGGAQIQPRGRDEGKTTRA